MAIQQVALATNNLLESMGTLAVEVGEEEDKKNTQKIVDTGI